MTKSVRYLLALIAGAALLLGGCSAIDEDRSDCGNDFGINYELRLVTNMSTEIRTELGMDTQIAVAGALKTFLQDIFTDFAHDVDLSFYDVRDGFLRLHHEKHTMDASETSYSLFLPVRAYMHTAVANLSYNPVVDLTGDETCYEARLQQVDQDTLDIHTTGLFTARLPMDVLEGVDQEFNVHLYMANCASALVLDPRNVGIEDMKAFSTGYATSFAVCDSIFRFPDAKDPVIRARRINVPGDPNYCFCSVNFPSREEPRTRTVIDTTDPFITDLQDESLWEYHVYVTLSDGSITKSVLYLRSPLRAGQFKVITGRIGDQGEVITDDLDVGVSVQLDWNEGINHEIPL
ncbi:MAG: hypothetical protein J6W74_02605 [Bacteroidales bacterium]|nr:hypothetical protein [Bacteroidales bacterium]